jgi:hypothetical protein
MRRAAALVTSLVAVATLSACGLGAGGTAEPSAPAPHSASSAPAPSPSPTQPPLADGVLAEVSAVARQQNGAELRVRMTVREPVDWNATEGAPIASRIAQICAGELDSTVFAQDDYRFVRIDISTETLGGDWKGGAVAVLPAPESAGGVGVVASGSATQIAVVGADAGPGDSVPHCAQPAVLTGAGSGEVDVAFADATPPAWQSLAFGFAVAPTTDGSAPLGLVFDSCRVQGATGQGVDWVKSSTGPDGNACAVQAT